MIVYNSYDFVRSENNDLLPIAINSLLNQTYKNFELIILDNQSSDDTPDICKKFEKSDERIRFIVDSEKRFPEASIEENFKNAKGKYVMIANDDDYWDENYILDLVNEIEKRPDIDVIYTNGFYIDLKGNKLSEIISEDDIIYKNITHPFSNYCKYVTRRNPIPINFGLFKKEAFGISLPFENFDNLKANVDNLYTAKLFLKNIKCDFYNKKYFHYRVKQRTLDPKKVADMPSIIQPVDILIYYVNHQFLFYKELINKINDEKINYKISNYLKLRTLFSLVKFSIEISKWVYNDVVKDFAIKKALTKYFISLDFATKNKISKLNEYSDFEKLNLDDAKFDFYIQRGLAHSIEILIKDFTSFLENLSFAIVDKEKLAKVVEKFNLESKLYIDTYNLNELIQSNETVRIENSSSSEIKVSVLTCSYNLKRFVDSTLLSVGKQNFVQFEHIVIDGASNDGSIDVLKNYKNIKLLSEKDSGYPEAFWKGLKLARGEYIIQCAISDCLANENWIKAASNFLDENPQVSLVWGLPQYIDENNKLGKVSFEQFHQKNAPSENNFFNYWLISSFIYPEGNLCVRKSVIENCYPHFDKIKKDELDWLTFNFNFNSKGYLSQFLPQVANLGRSHGDQLSGVLDKEGIMEQMWNNYAKNVKKLRYKILFGLYTPKFIDSNGNSLRIKFNRINFTSIFFKDIFNKINFKLNLHKNFIQIQYILKLFKYKIKYMIK